MKNKIYLFLYLGIFFSLTSCEAKRHNPVKKLEVKEKRLLEEISKIREKYEERAISNNSIFILRAKTFKDSSEIRISTMHPDDLTRYLQYKKDKLLGYFENNNKIVFVFGDLSSFFSETNQAKSFDFLNIKPKKVEVKQGQIEETLPGFEAVVWVYILKNDKIVFIKEEPDIILE